MEHSNEHVARLESAETAVVRSLIDTAPYELAHPARRITFPEDAETVKCALLCVVRLWDEHVVPVVNAAAEASVVASRYSEARDHVCQHSSVVRSVRGGGRAHRSRKCRSG